MADDREYSDAEVRAILDRALRDTASGGGGVGHADLQVIGEQIGVTPEAMSRAAAEVLEARLQQDVERAIRSRRRRWLALHGGIFALLNGLLFMVNYLTTPGEWWVLFSLFFWGLVLLLHGGLALGVGVSASAVAAERRRRSNQGGAKSPRIRVGAGEATAADEAPVEQSAPRRDARS